MGSNVVRVAERRALLPWLLLAGLSAGCFEAELELQLLPDGRGLARVAVELPREALAPGIQGQEDEALARAANQWFAAWQGVDAWTERDLLVLPEERRVRLVGTAWCRDLRRLRAPQLPLRLEVDPSGDELTVRLTSATAQGWVTLDPQAWAAERARLLDHEGALAQARGRVRLLLPGPVSEVRGASGEGRTVQREWEGARVRELLQGLVGELELLRERVAAGALAPAEAQAREGALLEGRLGISLRCAPPAHDGGAGGWFERGLAAAEEAWSRARGAGPGAPGGGPVLPPHIEEARREQAEAEADAARAQAEMERWRRELEEMEAEHEEEGLREAAEADPRHARLRVELLDAPPGVTAQLVATPTSEGATPLGAALQDGRWDGSGLAPGSWRITVLARLPEGSEWTFLREGRLIGGGFARVSFTWPRGDARVGGQVAPGPERMARAWSPELRVSAPLAPDGSFSLGPLPPGAWKVAVTEGHGPWVEDPALLPAAAEVQLRPDQALVVAPPGVAWDGQASQVLWR